MRSGWFNMGWAQHRILGTPAAIFEPWKLGERIAEVRKRAGFRAQADCVQHELGSRRAGLPRTRRANKKKAVERSPQRSLF